MEHLQKSFEFANKEQSIFEIPTNELIFDINKAKDVWINEFADPLFAEQIEIMF